MMKTKVILLLIVCYTFSFSQNTMPCYLKVGYDEAVPFHYKDKGGNIVGSDAKILQMIAQKLECSLEFIELPWSRTLKFLQSGMIDVGIGASYKPQRSSWAYFSVPYKHINHWIYTKNKEEYSHIFSIQDVFDSQMHLGVVLGWNYPHELRFALDDTSNASLITGYETFKQLPKVLNKDRVEAIIANPKMLKNEIANDPELEIFVPRGKYKEDLHFMFSKKTVSSDLIVEFNNILYGFIYDGSVEEILSKH